MMEAMLKLKYLKISILQKNGKNNLNKTNIEQMVCENNKKIKQKQIII